MADKFINYYLNLLRYNDKIVYIAFSTDTAEPYFHAVQLCKLLEIVNSHKVIKNNVDKSDIFYLKDIVKNYKTLYSNVQGTTKFLNEAGMLTLLLSSRTKKAKEIQYWVTHDVLPEIRKHGEYKVIHPLKLEIENLKKYVNEQQSEIQVLEHNMKTKKYKVGGSVYILRAVNKTLDFGQDEIMFIRFGRSKNMNNRVPQYDTCHKNRVQVMKTVYVEDKKVIENCVIAKMDKFAIQSGKDFFKCSYNDIIKEVASCVKFYDHVDIDQTPDQIEDQIENKLGDKIGDNKLSRSKNDFDLDKVVEIRIIDDEKFKELCDQNKNSEYDDSNNSTNSNYESDDSNDSNDSDEEIDEEIDEKIDEETDNEIIQHGGGVDEIYKYLYLKYKIKYLEFKFDHLII